MLRGELLLTNNANSGVATLQLKNMYKESQLFNEETYLKSHNSLIKDLSKSHDSTYLWLI